MTRVNREHKDSLFCIVFGEEHKENALSLYNAINGTSYDDPEQINITTLKDVIYVGVKNDTSFILDHTINLYEHQSTINPNMPLRGLEYFAEMYKGIIYGERGGRKRLYSETLVRIPAPRYYVFYNGKKPLEETVDLFLSDAYGGNGDIEVTAHVININPGHSQALLDACKPLRDYSEVLERVRNNMSKGMDDRSAVNEALDSCIREGILAELLRKERAKVTNSLLTALTDEEIKELHEWEMQTAIEKSHAEGERKLAELIAALMKTNRQDDVDRVLTDEVYRQRLYDELCIS